MLRPVVAQRHSATVKRHDAPVTNAALSSVIQHKMPQELGGKQGTERLNTRLSAVCGIQRDTKKLDIEIDTLAVILFIFIQ